MTKRPGALPQLCLEVMGLTTVMGAIILIAAFHVFGGSAAVAPRLALWFSIAALFLTALPIQAYILARLRMLAAENATLFEAATRDGLTRVLNRTAFKTGVEEAIQGLGRQAGDTRPSTLLIVDADHFKRINDRLGHPVGDQALVAIAATLRGSVRRDDIVGRIGGEEFGILLRGAGYEEALVVAERLRLAIHALSVGTLQYKQQLSVSMGGVTFGQAVPYDTLYRSADANLYRAKKSGRNRVRLVNLQPLPFQRHGEPVRATRTLGGPAASAAPADPRPAGRIGSA